MKQTRRWPTRRHSRKIWSDAEPKENSISKTLRGKFRGKAIELDEYPCVIDDWEVELTMLQPRKFDSHDVADRIGAN